MTGSVIDIGVTGLKAAQAGLSVASHNIANATTPGFHRQRAIQGTGISQETGSGFFGRGVVVETVQRAYSTFLDKALLTSQTQQRYLDSYLAQIKQLDNMLADPTSGLSPALQSFFASVHDVATSPSSNPSRQQLISQAEVLVARFNQFHDRFESIRDGVNAEIDTVTREINKYTGELAKLNLQIVRTEGDGTRPPNDLLDQRDQVLSQINELVRVTSVTESDGSLNVFFGTGQPLVLSGQSYQMTARYPDEDPENLGVYLTAGSAQIRVPEYALDGGKLDGLIDFRNEALDSVQNQVGRVAIALARTFNDQHKLGQDFNGALGGDFFREPSARTIGNTANTGNGVLGITYSNVSALTTSDYQLRYNGSTYTLTRLTDNTVSTFATLPQTVDGFTVSLSSGAIAAGDSFMLQPTRLGAQGIDVLVSDTSRIAAAAPIRASAALTNSGTAAITPGVAVDTTNAAFATPNALTPPILIRFTSATSYDIYNNTNPSSPVLLQAGITYNPNTSNDVFPTSTALDYGYRVALSGAAAAGDSFTVNINSGGTADNRNALLLGALQTNKVIDAGTSTYQSAYSQMVADVGNRTREVQVQSNAQDAFVKENLDAQQEFSGVNLDEEAADLIRYQQAYQAASRVIQMASRLFDEVLNAVR